MCGVGIASGRDQARAAVAERTLPASNHGGD